MTDVGKSRPRPKRSAGRLALLIGSGLVALGCVGATVFGLLQANADQSIVGVTSFDDPAAAALAFDPVSVSPFDPDDPDGAQLAGGPQPAWRLLIPALKVNARIQPVQTLLGPGAAPDHKKVGWDETTRPVDDPSGKGSTFVGGHIAEAGDPGALRKVGDLKPGDIVLTTGEAPGMPTRWVVYARTVQLKTDFEAKDIYWGKDAARTLVLGSCTGKVFTSGPNQGHYDSNVFVFARPA